MTVAHDAETTTNIAAGAAITTTHTPVGTPKGVWVIVSRNATSVDDLTAATYGGVAMGSKVFAADTVGEPFSTTAFFLGTGIPTGAQTVSVTQGTTTGAKTLFVVTVTAAADTSLADSDVAQESQADPQVALDSSSDSALRYVAITHGAAAPTDLPMLSGMTAVTSRDYGAVVARVDRQTAVSTGSFTIGYTAVSDDVAMVAVAIKEAGGTPHTAAPDDDEGLLDSQSLVAGYLRDRTDPLGLLDGRTLAADYLRPQTDNLGLTDSISSLTGSVRSLTDPVGLTDTATPVTGYVRSQTDPLGMVDDITADLTSGAAHTANPTDPLGLVDSISVVRALAVTITDPLGLTASGTVEYGTDRDRVGLTDSITVDHTTGTGHTFSRTDPLGLTDTATPAQGHNRTVSDNLGATDPGGVDVYDEADVLFSTDNIETVVGFARTQTDNLGLTDSITVDATVGGISHTVTITDGLGLADTLASVVAGLNIVITDPLGLTDSTTRTSTFARTVTDPLGLTDDMTAGTTGADFWNLDPAAFTYAPVSHTKAPVAFVRVGADDTPPSW